MIKLRPRQVKFKNDIKKAFADGYKKILAVAPCGFGKNPTAASIMEDAEKKGGTVLFMVHRKELIDQASASLDKLGVNHGVIKRKHPKSNPLAKVQLASWQTLIRKIYSKDFKFKPTLIIYDEAHQSVAPRPKEILDFYSDAFLIGFTATPYRMDSTGLKEIYQIIVTSCDATDLIKEGLLVKPKYYRCNNIELAKNKNSNTTIVTDDLIEKTINELEHEPDIIIGADVIRNFKKICGENKQAVVFCPKIENAERIAEKFNRAKIKAKVVDCHTSNREILLKSFARKEFQIIVNASLLSEGWDYPELDCVILMRNITSRALFRQACNRCMRIHPNKKEAYILDFFDNFSSHGMPYSKDKYSLENGVEEKTKEEKEDEDDAPITEFCVNCQNVYDVIPGIKVCPHCGIVLDDEIIKLSKKIIVEAKKDLEEVDEKKAPPTMDEKQERYNRLSATCMKMGHNPYWVNQQYKNIFGVYPRKMQKTEEFKRYSEEYSNDGEQKQQISKQLAWVMGLD